MFFHFDKIIFHLDQMLFHFDQMIFKWNCKRYIYYTVSHSVLSNYLQFHSLFFTQSPNLIKSSAPKTSIKFSILTSLLSNFLEQIICGSSCLLTLPLRCCADTAMTATTQQAVAATLHCILAL